MAKHKGGKLTVNSHQKTVMGRHSTMKTGGGIPTFGHDIADYKAKDASRPSGVRCYEHSKMGGGGRGRGGSMGKNKSSY